MARVSERHVAPSPHPRILKIVTKSGAGASRTSIPEEVFDACDDLEQMLKPDQSPSLDGLQGAVEYLLDIIRTARRSPG
jgi:hypothetical protein